MGSVVPDAMKPAKRHLRIRPGVLEVIDKKKHGVVEGGEEQGRSGANDS